MLLCPVPALVASAAVACALLPEAEPRWGGRGNCPERTAQRTATVDADADAIGCSRHTWELSKQHALPTRLEPGHITVALLSPVPLL